jgi:tetratricopeptide (TPR) repeat protein
MAAQELPLKRSVPTTGPYVCPVFEGPGVTDPEEGAQARELGSSAAQALILGDQVRARDFLVRAVELDPASIELGYRYARALEDLGDREGAIDEFCRILAIDPDAEALGDAQGRVEALAAVNRQDIPELAIGVFEQGLAEADAGRLESAVQAFTFALDVAPTWVDAVYNRGLVRAQLGQRQEAITDLQQYLTSRPGAPDATQVSQRIGQLQSLGPPPSAGSALVLGLILPGGGQFSTGRPFGGFAALMLAGGAAAAGFLVEEVTVRCLQPVGSGGECPEGQIFDEKVDQPYLIPALAVAGAISVIAAVEAFVKARGRAATIPVQITSAPRGPRLVAPRVIVRGSRVDFNLLRITF